MSHHCSTTETYNTKKGFFFADKFCTVLQTFSYKFSSRKRIYFSHLVSSTITCLQCRGTVTGLFSEDVLLWLKLCFKAATLSLLRTLSHSFLYFSSSASNYNTVLYFIKPCYIPSKQQYLHYKSNTEHSHSKKQKYLFSLLLLKNCIIRAQFMLFWWALYKVFMFSVSHFSLIIDIQSK